MKASGTALAGCIRLWSDVWRTDWWACPDSNREPKHYECSALTIELQARRNMISETTGTFNSRSEKLIMEPPTLGFMRLLSSVVSVERRLFWSAFQRFSPRFRQLPLLQL